LLNILDVFAVDQASRMKRKGRPKQPSPIFHLPPELWDRSTLPVLRPKDAQGLHVSGAQGIILFRFHVDERVQAEFPDWARGLYDNPPILPEDALLPSLPEVMGASLYAALKPKIRAARDAATVRVLSAQEVEEINSRPEEAAGGPSTPARALTPAPAGNTGNDASVESQANQNPMGQGEDDLQLDDIDLGTTDFMSRNLESFVALAAAQAQNPFIAVNPLTAMSGLHGVQPGPSPGSSVRARKQAKRFGSEVPSGAAMPVAKRARGVGVGMGASSGAEAGAGIGEGGVGGGGVKDGEEEMDNEIGGDRAFLESL
jgi:hypothetical protein